MENNQINQSNEFNKLEINQYQGQVTKLIINKPYPLTFLVQLQRKRQILQKKLQSI